MFIMCIDIEIININKNFKLLFIFYVIYIFILSLFILHYNISLQKLQLFLINFVYRSHFADTNRRIVKNSLLDWILKSCNIVLLEIKLNNKWYFQFLFPEFIEGIFLYRTIGSYAAEFEFTVHKLHTFRYENSIDPSKTISALKIHIRRMRCNICKISDRSNFDVER